MNLNEQVEEAATIRRDILFRDSLFLSGNLENGCLWQPCVSVFLCTNEIIIFFVEYSTQYPSIRHTVLWQVA